MDLSNKEYEILVAKVREFFSYLDVVEESDSGRRFRPNYVSSCRALTIPKLDKAMADMRECVGLPPAKELEQID